MQYLIQSHSPIAAAVRHAVVDILGVAENTVAVSGDFGVRVGEKDYFGLLPMLCTLRKNVKKEEAKAFLGAESALAATGVNQWVNIASLLSADAAECQRAGQSHRSLAKNVFSELDAALESGNLSKSFLASTQRATIADVLLYAAVHNHPEHAAVGPVTMQWSNVVHQDAYFATVKSDHVTLPETKEATSKGGSAYVKPSEEEIARRRQEKEKAKLEKEKLKAAEGKTAAPKEEPKSKKNAAKSADISDIDIRVGKFTNVRPHPDADRLYIEDMDIGSEVRTIVSGLVDHYKVEELNDSLCLVICNMKPKPLKGVTSQGMVLCASNESHVRLVRPPAGAKPGDSIVFGDFTAPTSFLEPLSGNKMTEVLSHLHTDGEGRLAWKELIGKHSGAEVSLPEMKNCVVK
ncbi:tyrosyl-tRNA synthetase [Angomonas deanei]|nr:tyrosyl-tRNA synthetase [Angomonas deanei]|eukprot:EPY35101.1 tyrosyl-tRNA synthetase [Angomonas deanei]